MRYLDLMEATLVRSSVKKKKIPIDENCSPAGVSEGNSEGFDLMEAMVVPSSVADNEDMLSEILSKLPRKSIHKFVCVSKKWRDIIKSTYFENLRENYQNYRRRMRPNLGLFYGRREFLLLGEEDDVTFSVLFFPRSLDHSLNISLKIVGYENGLVCLSQFKYKFPFKFPKTEIFVWNPATTDHRELPLPLSFEGEDIKRSPVLGFGFSNNSTDYKVVRITESLRPDHDGKFCYHTQVFTRGQNSWREIKGCIPSGNHNFNPEVTISVNGVFYWLANSHAYEIFALNLHDEVFHKIPLPSDHFIEQGYIRLYPWKKSIAIQARNTSPLESQTTKINVWLMTQDHSKDDDDQWNWTKLFTITYPKINVFGVWNDEFVYYRLNSTGNKSLCAYNPATKMERNIIDNIEGRLGTMLTKLRCHKVENYVWSRVSVW